jgi:CubicO group peptidase (beta-lactamase class C family)
MNHDSVYSRRFVLKGLAAGSAAWVLGDFGAAAVAGPGKLPRANPAAVGVDPAGVTRFLAAVNQKVDSLHSFMLLRRGQVAAEGWWAPYAPEHPHMLFSLSKSFTSTAVGLAVEEGLLTVDDPVISFFSNLMPERTSDNLAAMKVRHLLSMSTGHERDALGPMRDAPGGHWVKAFLALPVELAPGSRFVYNSAATYMCSAIIQKLTGMTVLDYLKPRLFGPLGIEGQTWETCPRGISTGGWGLSVKTEDIARFGQLYLQRGKWNGKQLLPERWVAEATSKHIANGTNPESDWNQGYGYQFWRCRHGAYRGDGAFGQYCVVMPQQEAVLAITSGLRDMQAVLNEVWTHLLPAMSSSSAGDPSDLKRQAKGLTVPVPAGKPTSVTAQRVSGKTYRLDANAWGVASIQPIFEEDGCTLVYGEATGERKLRCGAKEWVKGRAPAGDRGLSSGGISPVGARGAWESDDTYAVKVCYVDSPFVQTIRLKFEGDRLTVSHGVNVSFGPTAMPTLVGRA